MPWLRWIVIMLALLDAGYMTFDGLRALIVGDYLTPSTGEYAGQLGHWSKVVSAVGIEPRSTLMKTIFAGYGFVWLTIIGCFALKLRWAWWAMLIAAGGSLWYLVPGTASSLIQIILLLILAARSLPPT